MDNLIKIYHFRFNSSYYLYKNEEDKYFIVRKYMNGETATFDIKDNYACVNDVRYITTVTKEKIEFEIEAFTNVYNEIYDKDLKKEEDNMATNEVLELLKQQTDMIKEMHQKNPYEEAIVEAIVEKGKQVSTEEMISEVTKKVDEYIVSNYGALPKTIEVKTEHSVKQTQGLFHYQFEKILKLVACNIPTMLVGPAGSGKNHTLEQVAESLDLDFYFSNAITQEYKLTGFIDANGTYQETQFYKAFKNGGLFFLDEIDASIPEVLIILNSAIANKYFDFPNEKVVAHEDFKVVAAANTFGMGADNLYVGRSQLDAATLDRFAVVEFGYDPEVEKAIASSEELYDYITSLRKSVENTSVRFVVSMRATINASKLDGVLSAKDILEMVVLKGLEKSDINILLDNIDIDNEYVDAMKELTTRKG